jgi:hypothetical protein
MANEFYITAGLPPIDNENESGVNKFYITAGLVPDDTAEEPSEFIPRIIIF